MKCALFISLLLLWGCSTGPDPEPVHPSGLIVTEVKPDHDSHIMKQNLLQIAQIFDLSPFLFTKRIHIKTDAIPRSHPVLTLNIRYTHYPYKILAAFLHEEFHWWALQNKSAVDKAVLDLKKIYPRQRMTTYIHLIIGVIEAEAIKSYLGERAMRQVFSDFARKERVRPWVYGQVFANRQSLLKLVRKHKLMPPPLI